MFSFTIPKRNYLEFHRSSKVRLGSFLAIGKSSIVRLQEAYPWGEDSQSQHKILYCVQRKNKDLTISCKLNGRCKETKNIKHDMDSISISSDSSRVALLFSSGVRVSSNQKLQLDYVYLQENNHILWHKPYHCVLQGMFGPQSTISTQVLKV